MFLLILVVGLGDIVATIPMAVLRRRLDFRRLAMLGLVQSSVRSLSSIAFALFLAFLAWHSALPWFPIANRAERSVILLA